MLAMLKGAKFWAYFAVFLIVCGGLSYAGKLVYESGQASVQRRWDADKDIRRTAAAQRRDLQIEAVGRVDIQHRVNVDVIVTRTEEIVREVPVYIPVDTPDLPAGFGVLHDAAVLGVVPTPAFAAEFGGASYPARTVAETVVRNYGSCHLAYERVAAWERFYADLSAVGRNEGLPVDDAPVPGPPD
jgi:hypothetical protein